MNIGIIGSGNMGRTLGIGWAQAGHQVRFGSPTERLAAQATGARVVKAYNTIAHEVIGRFATLSLNVVAPPPGGGGR
jgi:predicted dinucleotide-binding enzyme